MKKNQEQISIYADLLSIKLKNYDLNHPNIDLINEVASDYSKAINEFSNLSKQSSWWGSRLWSKFDLKSLEEKEKIIRLKLIKILSIFKKELKDYEYNITDQNIYTAFQTIKKINSFGEKYKIIVIKDINSFLSKENINDKERKHAIGHIKNLLNDDLYLGIIINTLGNKNEINLNDYNKKYIKYNNKIRKFLENEDPEKPFNEKLYISILKDYGDFYLLKNKYKDKNFKSLKDFADFLTEESLGIKKSETLYFKNLSKIAHNAITRWLRRKTLSLSSVSDNRIRLLIAENLKDTVEIIDIFLNILEDKKSSKKDIEKAFYATNQKILSLFESLKPFLVSYYYEQNSSKNIFPQKNLREMTSRIDKTISFLAKNIGNSNE